MLDVEVQKKLVPINIQKTISVIILNRCGKKIYDSNILGKPMKSWVESSVKEYPYIILDYDSKQESKVFVKPHLKPSDYTLVLYSNTPLITKGVIKHLIEFATIKESVACKLPVGYIVQTEYLLKAKEIMFDSMYNFNLEAFYEINNKQDVSYVSQKLSKRINSFYMNNGVEIENIDTVLIEPSVKISSGVTIFSHVVLKGDTIIDSGSIIKENSVVIDSIIGKDCLVSSSNVTNSTLGDNVCIGSFCEIIDACLREEVVVGRYSIISGRTIRKKTSIPERSTLVKSKE